MIPLILEDAENGLTGMMRETIFELYDLLRDLDDRVRKFDQRIDVVFRASSTCQRIAKIKGVGPKTATAIIAAIGDGSDFKNGRHLSAWLGLVPRQHSSGDRQLMLRISKRGNQALRTVLVHGGRSVVRAAANKDDPRSTWVNQIRERRGFNKAAVAVANKNARIIWAVLRHDEPYREHA
jgi:transposase